MSDDGNDDAGRVRPATRLKRLRKWTLEAHVHGGRAHKNKKETKMKTEIIAAYAAQFTIARVDFRLGGSSAAYGRQTKEVVCDKILVRGPLTDNGDVWVSLFLTPTVWNEVSSKFGRYDAAVMDCVIREKHTGDNGKVFLLAEDDDCEVVNVKESEIKRPYPKAVTFDGSAKEDAAPGA